jgi:hypothetical protein
MLARNVERLHAILGLQNGIAMGVQQIMEELHVKLIVFHDQNGLGFRVHDFHTPPRDVAAKLLRWQVAPEAQY